MAGPIHIQVDIHIHIQYMYKRTTEGMKVGNN